MTLPRRCWRVDLGRMAFRQAHEIQLEVVNARISSRIDSDVILFVEHPAVFTTGRRGNCNNLKVSPAFLAHAGIQIHNTERGGDITFHGPGQLVTYPIMDLKATGGGILGFVENLEEAMIKTATDWNIAATRDPRNRGIWVDNKKIGSIGIAVRRGVAFHGMALNVNLSLEPFSWINPCGLEGIGVTAMNLEGQRPVTLNDVKIALNKHLKDIFFINLQNISIKQLKEMIK